MGRLDASTREIGMQSDAKGTQQLDMRASCGAEPFFERKLTISAFSAHGHLSIPKSVATEEFIPHLATGPHTSAMWLQALDVSGTPHNLHITKRTGIITTYSIAGCRPVLFKYGLKQGDYVIFGRKKDGTCVVSGRRTHIPGVASGGNTVAEEVAHMHGGGDVQTRCRTRGGERGVLGGVRAKPTTPTCMSGDESVYNTCNESDTETCIEECSPPAAVPSTPDRSTQSAAGSAPSTSQRAVALAEAEEAAPETPLDTPREEHTPCKGTRSHKLHASCGDDDDDMRDETPPVHALDAPAPSTPPKDQQQQPLQAAAQHVPHKNQTQQLRQHHNADVNAYHNNNANKNTSLLQETPRHAIIHAHGSISVDRLDAVMMHAPLLNQDGRFQKLQEEDAFASQKASGSFEKLLVLVERHPELRSVAHWFHDTVGGVDFPLLPAKELLLVRGQMICEIEEEGGVEMDTVSLGTVAETVATVVHASGGAAQPTASGNPTQHEGTQATAPDCPDAAAQLAVGEVTSRSRVAAAVPAATAAAARSIRARSAKAVHAKAERVRSRPEKCVKQERADKELQGRKRRRTCIEARQPQRDEFLVTSEKPNLLFGSFGAASITFCGGSATFRQLLAMPEGEKRAKAYSAFATYCTRMLHACGVGVQRDTRERGSEEVALEMPLHILEKLPVLQDLWEAVGDNDDAAAGNSEGSGVSTTFSPPASLWALACLILVVEGDADLWHIFGNTSRSARLLADTLQMADYLNEARATPELNEWMHEVFEEVLQAFKTDDGYTVSADDAPAVWHLCEVLLAVPEQHSIFAKIASQQPPALTSPPRTPQATLNHHGNHHPSPTAKFTEMEQNNALNNPNIKLEVQQQHAAEINTMHAHADASHACTSSQGQRPRHTAAAARRDAGSDVPPALDVIRLVDTPVEDVLNLPPPLCHAWFRHARAVALRLDGSDLAARSVATGALCSARALEELSLHASVVLTASAREREAQKQQRERERESSRALELVEIKAEGQDKSNHGPKHRKRKKGAGRSGCGCRGAPAKQQGDSTTAVYSAAAAAAAAAATASVVPAAVPCSFAVVQQCLMAPRRLRALHMHGIQLLPHELQSFGAILRSLAPSLEQLTLCQIQGRPAEHLSRSHMHEPHASYSGHPKTSKLAAGSHRAPPNPHAYSIDEKKLLCNALAQLSKLVTLTFPELYEFVSRGTDVMQPISCMDSLETVYVNPSSINNLCRVEPGIDFEPLPRGVCCCMHVHQ